MHAVLMKMIPAANPGRLVVLHADGRPRGVSDSGDGSTSFSYGVYRALGTRKDTFQDVMTYVPLAFGGKTGVREGETPMEKGRGFSQRDEQDHTAVAVISARSWASRFGRDPQVVGRTMYVKAGLLLEKS